MASQAPEQVTPPIDGRTMWTVFREAGGPIPQDALLDAFAVALARVVFVVVCAERNRLAEAILAQGYEPQDVLGVVEDMWRAIDAKAREVPNG